MARTVVQTLRVKRENMNMLVQSAPRHATQRVLSYHFVTILVDLQRGASGAVGYFVSVCIQRSKARLDFGNWVCPSRRCSAKLDPASKYCSYAT